MRNFQGSFETPKQAFICAFSICITVPLKKINAIRIIFHKDKFSHTKVLFVQNKVFNVYQMKYFE